MEDGQSYRYIRRWEVASCNLCQTYGKTELLGIKTPVAECFQISHVYNYPNNTNSETYECECFFSHYLNVKTNQCEDVESIGIIPPLINYFLNIPMLIIAFVIAYRLYINKATEFWRKNPQYKNNKKKLNPAMKAALIACIFLFITCVQGHDHEQPKRTTQCIRLHCIYRNTWCNRHQYNRRLPTLQIS